MKTFHFQKCSLDICLVCENASISLLAQHNLFNYFNVRNMHSNLNRNQKPFVYIPHLLALKGSYIVVFLSFDQQDHAVDGITIDLFVGKPDFFHILFVYIAFDALRLSHE